MLYNQLLEPISTDATVGTLRLSTPPYTPHNLQSPIKTLIPTPLLQVAGDCSYVFTHVKVLYYWCLYNRCTDVSKPLSNNRPSPLTHRLPHSANTTVNNSLTHTDTALFIVHNNYTSSKHIVLPLRNTSTHTYVHPGN